MESRNSPPKELLPGIIVMNYKYFLDPAGAPRNGDLAFVMSVIRVLREENAFYGMILYQEDEIANAPLISYDIKHSILCATVVFNANMAKSIVKDAIMIASEHLATQAHLPLITIPLFYHQDEKLLDCHPDHLPLCITHHVPIYDDFIRHFSALEALAAFGGADQKGRSLKKVTDLRLLQENGIKQLQMRSNAFIIKISELQGHYFERSGFPATQIHPVAPPIHSIMAEGIAALTENPTTYTPPAAAIGRHFLFTAVARMSHFKNIELLIDAAVILLFRDVPIFLFICGAEDDAVGLARRDELRGRVPDQFQQYIDIVPKVSKPSLYSIFTSTYVRQNGIFACSSRYETLAITPLEAALSGVTTVIQENTEQVEAARYFPDRFVFKNNPEALADQLEHLFRNDLHASGQELESHIKAKIPLGAFERDLLRAWREFSRLATEEVDLGEQILLPSI
jgi:glycosyltransferase involved in cell wall biosynthesis